MSRRPHGEGTIGTYSPSPGKTRYFIRWLEPVDQQDPSKGKRRASKAGFETYDEARDELRRRLGQVASGASTDVRAERLRFGPYARRWLDGYHCSPGTRAFIERVLVAVEPHIGRLTLADVRPSDLAACYRALEAGGGLDGDGKRQRPLASSTVARYAGWLVTVFNAAVDEDLLAKNPASHRRSGRPRGASAKRRKPIAVWNPDQAHAFLAWAHEAQRPWATAWDLFVRTGLRTGELLALEWPDVDLTRGRLSVSRQMVDTGTPGEHRYAVCPPKGGKVRTVVLDADTCDLLLNWRRRQSGSVVVAAGRGPSRVFPGRPGARANKAALLHSFRRDQAAFAEAHPELALPPLCTHDLRHTHASLLLAAGVDVKVIQERLGHSSARITLDTYSHLMPDAHAGAAEKLSVLLSGGQRSANQERSPGGRLALP